MVVAIHSRGQWVEWGRLAEASKTKLAAIFFALTRSGTESVLVFFVLSGFLVGGKVIERLAEGTFDLRSYVIDRVTRIWTPLIPALVWSAVVAFWVGKPVSWVDLGGNFLGLQVSVFHCFAENIPLWSLAYEIWFYVLAACVASCILGGTKSRMGAVFGLALGFAVFTKLGAAFLFAWLLGAATYWLCSRPRRPLLAAVGIALMAAGYICSQLRSATVSVNTSTWARYAPSSDVATLMLSMGMACFLPFLAQLRPSSKFGESFNALGGKLAAFSYTLYLTHYPVLYVWEHYLPERRGTIDAASVALYLLRIASCVAFGWLCYLPFEKQTSRLRKWLRKVWITRPSGAATTGK
jgi:peptidoglycan/LPS O-acetylase OafA/YrhL